MAIDDYANFDLLVLPAGASGYQARVLRSLAGQGQTSTFSLPFSQEELRRFFWLAGVAFRKLRLVSAPSAPPLTPRQFGERLYAAVFAGAVGECYVRSLDAAARSNRGLRICLRLNDAPELAIMPWEYLFAPSPSPGFVALSSSTPIVRFPELGSQEQPLTVTPPLRILAVVSNPQDVRPLDVEGEYRRLERALAGLVQRNLVRLERLAAPTVAALQARLRDRQAGDVHILHFMGHGDFDEDRQAGGLYFENGAGAARLLTAENLAILLKDHRPLRLVFLNACEGARGGRDDFFVGTAQTLMQQGAPAAVAMQFPIGDEAAIALAQEFYQALAQGLPVDACIGGGAQGGQDRRQRTGMGDAGDLQPGRGWALAAAAQSGRPASRPVGQPHRRGADRSNRHHRQRQRFRECGDRSGQHTASAHIRRRLYAIHGVERGDTHGAADRRHHRETARGTGRRPGGCIWQQGRTQPDGAERTRPESGRHCRRVEPQRPGVQPGRLGAAVGLSA